MHFKVVNSVKGLKRKKIYFTRMKSKIKNHRGIPKITYIAESKTLLTQLLLHGR